MKLSFGKYRGYEVEELIKADINYLMWVSENFFSEKHSNEIQFIKEQIQPHIEAYNASQREINNLRKPHLQVVARLLKSAALKKVLQRGQNISVWVQGIINSLEEGKLLSEKAIDIVVDMCAKASGRRNSKKYLETAKQVSEAFRSAQLIRLNNVDGQH